MTEQNKRQLRRH